MKSLRLLFLVAVVSMLSFNAKATVWPIPNTVADTLERFIEGHYGTMWQPGDTIMVSEASTYVVNGTVDFFQEVTLMGDPSLSTKPTLQFQDNGFRAKEDTISISIIGLKLNGYKDDGSRRNHALRFDQAGWQNYNDILIQDCEIWGFKGVVQLYKNKNTVYESFTMDNCLVYDIEGDYMIDPKLNAVKEFTISNSTFYDISHGIVANFYFNDGTMTTIEQNITIDHNTFFRVTGNGNKSLLQINDGNDGSLNVSFSNNIVHSLWYDMDPWARPFRINEQVGDVMINNSVFYNFESSYQNYVHNLDSVVLQANVDTASISFDDPNFMDTAFYNFTISAGNPLLTAGTDGGPIGDPRWVSTVEDPWEPGARCHLIPNTPADTLERFIEGHWGTIWQPGDTIVCASSGTYVVNGTVDFFQEVTIMGDPRLADKPELQFEDNGFRAKEDTISISIIGLKLNGYKSDGSRRNHALRFDQAGWQNYNDILIQDCEIWGFKGVVQLYKNKHTVYESFTMDNCVVYDIEGDYMIDPRINAVKEFTISNSTFYDIAHGILANFYFNDGTMTTIEQNITIDHNTFFRVTGNGNKSLLQINDGNDGSLNVTFSNNIVQSLWYDMDPWARPFRINELVGDVMINNSVFYDFYSAYQGGVHNLDTVVLQANVDTANISKENPMFADTTAFDFTIPDDSPLYSASTTGGAIGDPDWAPLGSTKIVSITPILTRVIPNYEEQMEVTVTLPEGITEDSVTWSVENVSGEATIDADGVLNPVAKGVVKVKAALVYNSAFNDEVEIEIVPQILVESIVLTASADEISNFGGFITIDAAIEPANADDKTLVWSISDTTMAKLSENTPTQGKINALDCGTLTVTCTAVDGLPFEQTTPTIQATVDVVITGQLNPESIELSADADAIDTDAGTLQINATLAPASSCTPDITWTVDDEEVATIDDNGLLTAVGNGTVVVTGKYSNVGSTVTDDLTITVSNQVGIHDAELARLAVSPNPATQSFVINNSETVEVAITNLLGKTMLIENVEPKSTIDISSLRSGIYIVNVKIDNEAKALRLIKQ